MREHLDQALDDDDRVQEQEHGHERDGDADRLAEAEQEHAAEHEQQEHGDGHGVPLQRVREERGLQQVHGRVGRGQGDGDDPRRGHEPEQDEDEYLAAPERQQVLEHGHGPLAVRALLGDAGVHREHAQQGQQHDEQGCQR